MTCVISPADGTANTCGTPLFIGSGGEMLVENSGHFLYLQGSPGVVVFSVDQTTGDATQVASLPGIILTKGSSIADPMGPYIYSTDPSATAGGVHVYLVDQQTGNLTEISGSPFGAGVSVCCQGLAITGNPGQAISGPAVTIFPSTAVAFSATAGTVSATQVFSIVNVGNQLLTLNSISISGTNASSFSQTNTCLATLAPNAHCSVSITFNPATAGTFTATLQVSDNAPSSPQTLSLNGNGLTPIPGVSFSPPSLSFPLPPFAATTQGTSSASEVLTVISTGNTTLHISAVSLAGPNPSDFSFTNNCPAALAPTANCTISVVFSPIAPGQRTATLTFSDDAPNSPQTVSLSGTAVPAVSGGAAPNGSTSATVSAGQPAQYQLQLTPGTGFTGTISLSCSGAPLGAVCQVPANVSLANGTPATFTVTVTTSGPAMAPPSTPMRFRFVQRVPVLLILAPLLVFLWLLGKNNRALTLPLCRFHLTLTGTLPATILYVTLAIAGCGGGNASVAPPPLVTPSGTSTITINFSAMSSSGQPLQLSSLQLTLKVN